MRPATLLFVHGWGFDASLWQAVAAELTGWRVALAELGYFTPPRWPAVTGPVAAIGHSLGSMLLLRNLPAGCRGLVAINGFDHFAGRADAAGVARRPLDRMIARFAAEPQAVVAEFRRRCGAPPPPAILGRERLEAHLHLLRDGDERPRTAAFAGPILSLQADDDPILPAALRSGAFAAGARVQRARSVDGGHCLPLARPRWCADRMRAWLEELA